MDAGGAGRCDHLGQGGMQRLQVGQVDARGKGVLELQKLVTERLRKYISDPVVTVSVQEVNRLLTQFEQAQKMMKMVAKGGMQKMLRGLKGAFPGLR